MPDTNVCEVYRPPTVVAIGTLEALTQAVPKPAFIPDGYKGILRTGS